MSDAFASPLLSPIFESETVARIFSDRGILQAMLDFEAALAMAEADTGVIPADVASAIADVCRAELYDLAATRTGGGLRRQRRHPAGQGPDRARRRRALATSSITAPPART